MAIREMTDKTGKRIADALEKQGAAAAIKDVKIPHVTDFDFRKLCRFAYLHGLYTKQEIVVPRAMGTNDPTPYFAFLEGMKSLSNFEVSDGGRIAFASADYLQMLYYELTTTRLSQYISLKDGKISGINGCTVKELGSEHLPAGGAFVILSSDMVKALNALEAAGQLDDETALEQILTENPEGIYFHGEQPWLRTLDVDVEQGDTGKIIVTINTAKTDTYQSPGVTSTGHWLFGAADTSEKLPTPVYGTSCDISTSSSSNGWYGCIPLDPTQVTAQGKYTILGDNKFEIDVSALTNASYGGIPNSSGSTTPSALKYFEIVEVFRTMKPAGRRIKPLNAGL